MATKELQILGVASLSRENGLQKSPFIGKKPNMDRFQYSTHQLAALKYLAESAVCSKNTQMWTFLATHLSVFQ